MLVPATIFPWMTVAGIQGYIIAFGLGSADEPRLTPHSRNHLFGRHSPSLQRSDSLHLHSPGRVKRLICSPGCSDTQVRSLKTTNPSTEKPSIYLMSSRPSAQASPK